MKNYLIRALAYHKQARLFFVENTDLARAICGQSNVRGRLLTSALATTVSCASLMVGTLKGNQRITMKLQAGQKGLRVFADCDSQGNVRGYLSEEWLKIPPPRLESQSLADLFGDRGYVQVIKDVGMNRTVTGITDMPYGNIVDDLSHHFAQSEQTVRKVLDLCPTLHATRAPVSDLPGLLFGETEIMSTEPTQAFCGCSKGMFYPMLAGLGATELKDAVAQERTIDMVCHACGHAYSFSPAEIAGLIVPH